MKQTIQTLTDKAAIGLSLACTIHCLAVPLALILLPSLAALQLDNEAFHKWMIVAVIPISVYALTVGCKQHKRYHLLALGLLGIVFLVGAITVNKAILGDMVDVETMEKILTAIGATIIAYGHYKNYHLCQHHENCGSS